jgi:hypothetical protein
MRALALVALAACGYPEPPDHCEGPCELFAIDRPIEGPATLIFLEGTLRSGDGGVSGGARADRCVAAIIGLGFRCRRRYAGASPLNGPTGTRDSELVRGWRPSFDLNDIFPHGERRSGRTARAITRTSPGLAMITITPADATMPVCPAVAGRSSPVSPRRSTMVTMDGSPARSCAHR